MLDQAEEGQRMTPIVKDGNKVRWVVIYLFFFKIYLITFKPNGSLVFNKFM